MLLKRATYEFSRLALDDLSIIAWVSEEHPKFLHDFLEEFIGREYTSKGIQLDVDRLYHEILDLCEGRIRTELKSNDLLP